jgi:hypothetical protein
MQLAIYRAQDQSETLSLIHGLNQPHLGSVLVCVTYSVYIGTSEVETAILESQNTLGMKEYGKT